MGIWKDCWESCEHVDCCCETMDLCFRYCAVLQWFTVKQWIYVSDIALYCNDLSSHVPAAAEVVRKWRFHNHSLSIFDALQAVGSRGLMLEIEVLGLLVLLVVWAAALLVLIVIVVSSRYCCNAGVEEARLWSRMWRLESGSSALHNALWVSTASLLPVSLSVSLSVCLWELYISFRAVNQHAFVVESQLLVVVHLGCGVAWLGLLHFLAICHKGQLNADLVLCLCLCVFFDTLSAADSGSLVLEISFLCFKLTYCLVFSCQYQCSWLPGKTRVWNDQLCVECDAECYSLTLNGTGSCPFNASPCTILASQVPSSSYGIHSAPVTN